MCRSVLAPSGLSSTPALKTRAPSRTGVGFVCETLQRRFPRRLHASTTRPQVGRLPLLQPRGLPRRAARRRLAAEADGGRPARAGCGLAAQPRGRHAAAADGAGTFQRTSRDSTRSPHPSSAFVAGEELVALCARRRTALVVLARASRGAALRLERRRVRRGAQHVESVPANLPCARAGAARRPAAEIGQDVTTLP